MRFAPLIVAGVLATGVGARTAAAQLHVTATRNVYIHRGPSRASAEVGVFEQGDTAVLLSHRGGYDRVELADSTIGWVYARFVHVDSSSVTSPAVTPPAVTPAGQPVSDIASLPKPEPQEAHAAACEDIGRPNRANSPVDTATDLLKNRIDDGQYQDVSFDAVLQLSWKGLARRRYQWTADQTRQVAADEGAAIAMVGYLVAVKPEGPEQTNCELPDTAWHDWHMWLVATEAEAAANDRTRAVVVEVTPRVRQLDSARFDLARVRQWVSTHQRVRVSGWLLLDPDHPDQVAKTRGTTWEIHPVMHIEAVP